MDWTYKVSKMSQEPLVSIICVCFNQGDYILEALQSVVAQDYPNLELIIVDDASTDDSTDKIIEFCKQFPSINSILHTKNIGHCAAFNSGLALAKGDFIIDLAGDDVLLPNRVSLQMAAFKALNKNYAVVFTDTYIIDENGRSLGTFYKRDAAGQLKQKVPTGNIYKDLIRKMVLSSPTMMMRKSVLDALGGYDATLSYEDYDFWVRSGKNYKYFFLNEITTKKRKVKNSQGSQFYKNRQNKHLESTLKVCHKAKILNQNKGEDLALAVSVSYHLQLAYLTDNHPICIEFYNLLKTLKKPKIKDVLFVKLAKQGVKANYLYRWFLKWFRGIK